MSFLDFLFSKKSKPEQADILKQLIRKDTTQMIRKETRKFLYLTDQTLSQSNYEKGDLQKLAERMQGELVYEDCDVEYKSVRDGENRLVRGWVIYFND